MSQIASLTAANALAQLTLPLIHALQHTNERDAAVITAAIAEKSTNRLDEVLRIVQSSGAMDYTQQAAHAQKDRAAACLGDLPDNAHRDALHTLAEFCVDRLR